MPQAEGASWQFDAIGTSWQIDSALPLEPAATTAVLGRIERFEEVWSRFRSGSLVSHIATTAGEFELPEEADGLLGFYGELNEITAGAVNPLIGQTLSDLGYDAEYSLVTSDRPAPVPDWDTVQWRRPVLTTIEPVLLDVGAAGKGLLVDLVSSVLWAHGLNRFTVDASGDLYHHGATPIRIAMEHPHDPTRAIGVVDLEPEQALCASATNRRAWGDGLHHVLDGRTGRPTDDIVATWVVAGSCMWADGLATAHFLAEPAALMARFEHDYVRIHASGRVEWSPTLSGEVFA